MNREIYVKLGERMNKFDNRYPIIDAYINVLKKMCTEEEAAFLSIFPEDGQTLAELADLYQKNETEIAKLLDKLVYDGIVFYAMTDAGEKEYSVIPLFPGAMEHYMMRRFDKPDEIEEYITLFTQLEFESKEYINKLMSEDPEKARSLEPSAPLLRTITLNEALPPDKIGVYPYEDILKMVDKQTSFSVSLCVCKEMKAGMNDPCKVKGIPRHCCMHFGKMADYYVENDLADSKRITKEECLEMLNVCNKAGLVQNVNNFVDDLQYICNCCSCCCGVLAQVKIMGSAASGVVDPTNFIPYVDDEICTGCGECVEKCPVGAMSLKDDVASVNKEFCLGCGHCATVCPMECISLKRVGDKKVELGNRKMGFGH